MKPPQRRQVERMRPSRAGSSSQSRGSVWFKQRAGFLAASNSAAVGFLASGAGRGPIVGVPVVLAFVAVEVPAVVPASVVLAGPAAVPAVGGEPAPASRLVEVLPVPVVSAGAGRVQSRCRSASNPAASGVAVLVPGAGAAGPAVRVATVPAVSGLFVLAAGVPSRPGGAQVERVGVEPAAGVPSGVASVAPVGAPAGVPVEVSAVPSGFPGGRFVLAVGAVSGPAVVLAVVILATVFLSFASAFRAADQERTRFWSLMG